MIVIVVVIDHGFPTSCTIVLNVSSVAGGRESERFGQTKAGASLFPHRLELDLGLGLGVWVLGGKLSPYMTTVRFRAADLF